MVEIFHEIIGDLPSVFNTLQESETPSNEPITTPDNVMPTVNVNNPSLEGGIDNIALQFTNNHLSRTSYRRPQDIIAFIQSEYKGMVHESRIIFEDGFLCILVQMACDILSCKKLLLSKNQVSEDIPCVVYAAWLEAAKNIVMIIFQQYDVDDHTSQAHMLFSHGTRHGIHSYNFFHDLDASWDAMVHSFRYSIVFMVVMATYTFAFLKNPPPTQQILYAPWQCPDGYARVVLSQLVEYPSITSHVLTGDVHLWQFNELEADEPDIEDDAQHSSYLLSQMTMGMMIQMMTVCPLPESTVLLHLTWLVSIDHAAVS
ncbi:hypothetical protein EDC04DRAFT_2609416 [Pisolithus marmoratus]|nr:hypothetical protein EDC04DRAFT_2609416 [Pisolithus marmoratus]